MCIGLPMTVVECGADGDSAVCERRGGRHAVSLLLLGPQPAGTHLLVHLGNAVRVLDAVESRQIDDALDGLTAAINGDGFEHLFADLVGREPELPDHLKAGGHGYKTVLETNSAKVENLT